MAQHITKKEAIIMAVRFPRKITFIMLIFVLLLITLMGSGIFAWLFLSELAIQKHGIIETPIAHYMWWGIMIVQLVVLAVLVRYMLVWIQQNATYPAAWVLSARLRAAALLLAFLVLGNVLTWFNWKPQESWADYFLGGLLIALFATTVIMTRRAIKVEGAASDWIADIEAEAQAKEIFWQDIHSRHHKIPPLPPIAIEHIHNSQPQYPLNTRFERIAVAAEQFTALMMPLDGITNYQNTLECFTKSHNQAILNIFKEDLAQAWGITDSQSNREQVQELLSRAANSYNERFSNWSEGGQQILHNLEDYFNQLGLHLGDRSTLRNTPISGFDLVRVPILVRRGFMLGYLSEQESRQYLEEAGLYIVRHYPNWKQFAYSYLVSYLEWHYRERAKLIHVAHTRVQIAEYLLTQPNSIVQQNPLDG